MLLTKPARLALIYQRLTDAAAAASRPAALALLQRVFREVEDQHSGVSHEPEHPDRMHPPVEAMEEDLPDHPAAKRYRHKRHCTLIADNGAFEIHRFLYASQDGRKRRVGEQTDFSKPGADGQGVA
ncbi:MAG: hypothetical protein ACKVY0_26110 [Prosthecobacter sp.]|uniref:hypothetical protein n=1 Tax=Prosthecobacter sp. TaxID=1965333 RepID=UPI00390451D4